MKTEYIIYLVCAIIIVIVLAYVFQNELGINKLLGIKSSEPPTRAVATGKPSATQNENCKKGNGNDTVYNASDKVCSYSNVKAIQISLNGIIKGLPMPAQTIKLLSVDGKFGAKTEAALLFCFDKLYAAGAGVSFNSYNALVDAKNSFTPVSGGLRANNPQEQQAVYNSLMAGK